VGDLRLLLARAAICDMLSGPRAAESPSPRWRYLGHNTRRAQPSSAIRPRCASSRIRTSRR
jgi:hypothetical protein